MPLESPLQYVADLNPSNPTAPDGLNQGDDHLRGIKLALKNTFPNFTDAALSATQADLDAVVATVNTTGVSVLADAGVHFKTNITDGFSNPAAGEVDGKAGGNIVHKSKSDQSFEVLGALKVDTTATVTGSVTAGAFVGPGAVPIGPMPQPWFLDTLPDSKWGTYVWANGQIISSANTVCPEYLALVTTALGGNGTTTCGVPDMREVAAYGKGTMGGTSSPGRITNYTLNTIGAFIGVCLVTLTQAMIPTGLFTFNDTTHTHSVPSGGGSFGVTLGGGGNAAAAGSGQTTGATSTGCSITDHAGGGSHDNVSPGVVCNFVVRIA